MLALGMLPEGHLDKSQTYLIGTNEIYEQYCRTKEELERRKQVEEEKREQDKTLSEAEKAIAKEIEEGKAQVAEIRRLNDALPEPIISEKLYQLEKISEKIFLYVEKHPDQLEEIQRLKSYYLPTMLKLVTAYHKVKQEEIKSDNIDKMCSQIEETLDTMNSALEYMYNELYADEALDVATDISVLKTMLAREGLVGNEFENIKEEQKDE
ncbi:MAG: 5-bromo-4-chloroindolyl phosphate hydrolysis family protein, partial [Firmicutes bacterium]|nr:5-bromo-4-chloroindolyl phosphate hydrolysis family protein [Candidatus Scybalomonas excrementavium]